MDMDNIEVLSPSENERRVNEELAEIAREDALYNAQFIENLDGPSTSRTNGKYFLHNANQLLEMIFTVQSQILYSFSFSYFNLSMHQKSLLI